MVRTLTRRLALSFFLILPGVVICLSATSAQEDSSPVVVHMTDEMRFVPEQITIKVGQTVEWVSEADAPAHTVSTDPDKAFDPDHVAFPKGAKPFDSGVIKAGKSFRHTFTVAGVYRYVCLPHEDMMRGEITVTE